MSVSHVALPVTGSALEASVRRLLLSLNYPRCNVDDALLYVEANTTIDGCPVVEREDWQAVEALVIRHTGHVECDPSEWPAWTDADRWATDAEPSQEDRSWWAMERERLDSEDLEWNAAHSAAVADLTAGLVPADLMPICGGSPTPDEKPVRVAPRRSRAVRGEYGDADQLRNHNCV